MGGTEKEVAFRKKRRDYSKNAKQDFNKEHTVIKVEREKRIKTPLQIDRKSKQIHIDKKKFETNSKRKESENFKLPTPDDKVALVIRFAGSYEFLCSDVQKLLSGFRLKKQFDAVFVPLTDENKQKLKSISHTIAYGVAPRDIVRNLITTRAHTIKDGSEVVVSSNKIVSDSFGGIGLECLDDIVDSIVNADEILPKICRWLCPFHLNTMEIKKTRALQSNGGKSGWYTDIREIVNNII